MNSKLILVPTPVGNLEDITLRAIRLLRDADLILAEDTRTSGNLLRHLDIHKPLRSYHAHNEHRVVEDLVDLIASGQKVALVTDAGTPGISDPGFLIVRECIRKGIEVETLPGPTAFVPALVNSGLPCDKFCFEGFLPVKKGRQTRMKELSGEKRTMIFYESPFRLVKTLKELATHFGDERIACVSRELSKLHEENRRGTLNALAAHYESHPPKGEIVLLVAGSDLKNDPEKEEQD
ncbi:MAG: 16S rRNA (cytidine(1402)-2'-O)-methyltransferase [Bacteroidota bacterium]